MLVRVSLCCSVRCKLILIPRWFFCALRLQIAFNVSWNKQGVEFEGFSSCSSTSGTTYMARTGNDGLLYISIGCVGQSHQAPEIKHIIRVRHLHCLVDKKL